MKNTLRIFIAVIVLVVLVFSTYTYAYASNSEIHSNPVEASTSTRSTNINTTWKTILSSSTGFNRTISVSAITYTYISTITTAPCDIRLLDSNNNVLWTGYSAGPGNGDVTNFWCGSDVCKVQIRTTVGEGTASAW